MNYWDYDRDGVYFPDDDEDDKDEDEYNYFYDDIKQKFKDCLDE